MTLNLPFTANFYDQLAVKANNLIILLSNNLTTQEKSVSQSQQIFYIFQDSFFWIHKKMILDRVVEISNVWEYVVLFY